MTKSFQAEGVIAPAALETAILAVRDIMFDRGEELRERQQLEVISNTRTIEGARNLVTLGQFMRIMPMDTRRRSALLHYLYDPEQPSGYDCDKRFGIDVQYTKRAADALVRKIIDAQELVNA
ncbi:hypothetical protein [Vibrio phage CKB-S1]|nr:hypothetical protein [Vibrio phage CKB-S1]